MGLSDVHITTVVTIVRACTEYVLGTYLLVPTRTTYAIYSRSRGTSELRTVNTVSATYVRTCVIVLVRGTVWEVLVFALFVSTYLP